MPAFGGLLSFTDETDGDADDAAKLADTTRTTLDSCFVVLATGFVGLISDFSAVTSDVGFVSTTDVVDIGAVSGILLAFGGSVLNKLIIIEKRHFPNEIFVLFFKFFSNSHVFIRNVSSCL